MTPEASEDVPPLPRRWSWRVADYLTDGVVTLLWRRAHHAEARASRLADRASQIVATAAGAPPWAGGGSWALPDPAEWRRELLDKRCAEAPPAEIEATLAELDRPRVFIPAQDLPAASLCHNLNPYHGGRHCNQRGETWPVERGVPASSSRPEPNEASDAADVELARRVRRGELLLSRRGGR